jgi:prepilin-type N-terminal cleavage/methylation domain-containing protein
MRSRHLPAPPGFSLLEISVVLAILAAAIAALPSRLLPALSGRAAVAAAAAIATDLRAVRDAARTEAAERDVLIGPDGGSYRLPGGMRALPADTRLAGPPRLRFFADGSASAAALSVIVGGHRAWVRVAPLTGRIETDADAN